MKKYYLVLFLAALGLAFSPKNTRTITGLVIAHNSQEKLIGASIVESGTSNGTVTDIDGKFELKVSASAKEITVSYTGFISETVKLDKAKQHYEVQLNQGVILSECIVMESTMDYNKSKRKLYSIDGSPVRGCVIPQTDIHNTEDYDYLKENVFLSSKVEPLSTFSIDVDRASYSNMRRFIRQGNLPPKDAIRIEELINYFNYDYPQPKGNHPFYVETNLASCPWNTDHQLLQIGLQGEKIPTEELPNSNLVFLIDVSGSMNSPNKLGLLKESFNLLVDQLRPNDKVAIVVYAGAAGTVLPSTSGANKMKIKEAINDLRAGGSTAGAQGIKLAYQLAVANFIKNGNNRVILATDGDFNVGMSSDSELERLIEKKRESGVYLSVMGFGMGNYKDNKMQKLADKGNGNHAYIDDIAEAKKIFITEFGGTLFTIAKDVKLQIEFNPQYVQAYRLIGYENRMLAAEDFNDDKKDAGELGAGHTVTAIYEIIPTGVETDLVAGVDDLKYQRLEQEAKNKEMCTIKLRYKAPDADKSQLLQHEVKAKMQKASQNMQWASAVAQFGMLMRESDYVQNSSFTKTLEQLKSSKGKDVEGFRAEFISLVEMAERLKGHLSAAE